MKILVTGAAGRIGRAIYTELKKVHDVVGIDRLPSSSVDYVGDIRNQVLVSEALDGVNVIVHTAALHAPHVGFVSDSEFASINVKATEKLALQGVQSGVKHFIFTSTTALYGYASTLDGTAAWIDETVFPKPRTVYHTSKIAAEKKLEEISHIFNLPVTVLQMSRCFPEPVDLMVVYRLTRGIDARDVAIAHLRAIDKRLGGFNRFIVSAKTPFDISCCQRLYQEAHNVISEYAPDVAREFTERGWILPSKLDRVYNSAAAQQALAWVPKYGADSVLKIFDKGMAGVLPLANRN